MSAFLIFRNDFTECLCEDNMWRNWLPTSFPKEYKRKGSAIKRAKQVNGVVIELPDHVQMDKAFNCFSYEPTDDGKNKVIHYKLEDFAV